MKQKGRAFLLIKKEKPFSSGLINKACILNWCNKQKRQAFLFNTRGTFRQVPTRRIRLSFVECAYLDLRDIFFIILEV